MAGWICAGCGKIIEDFKGSEKHPYCKECYKNLFQDNDINYMVQVNKEHKNML